MPIQPINQTFTYGKQGTIEYKPNWGQPITEAGQWQGASGGPALSTTAGGGIDPYAVYNKNLKELNEHYKRREKTLGDYGLSQEAHNRAVQQIRQEYDGIRFKFTSTKSQLDDIEQGIASGQIDPIEGLQAQFRLVSPQGTVEAMFSKPERQPTVSAVGMSLTGREKYVEQFDKLRDGMLEYGDKKWYRWDTKQASKKKMIKRFFGEWKIANLNDPRNAAKIPGFLNSFTESMSKDDRTMDLLEELLDPKTGDPRMLAAFSPDSSMKRGFMNQFGSTKPTIQDKIVSPVAEALKPKLSVRQKIQAMSPIGAALLYKEFAAKRKAATRKLPIPKTKTEYDSLPSGTQYIGTDGQMRVKK